MATASGLLFTEGSQESEGAREESGTRQEVAVDSRKRSRCGRQPHRERFVAA
jgi:hypothetical protein